MSELCDEVRGTAGSVPRILVEVMDARYARALIRDYSRDYLTPYERGNCMFSPDLEPLQG